MQQISWGVCRRAGWGYHHYLADDHNIKQAQGGEGCVQESRVGWGVGQRENLTGSLAHTPVGTWMTPATTPMYTPQDTHTRSTAAEPGS